MTQGFANAEDVSFHDKTKKTHKYYFVVSLYYPVVLILCNKVSGVV